MTYKKIIELEDGTFVTLEQLTGKEDPEDFLKLINPLIREGAFINRVVPVTLAEEKEWLSGRIKANKKGKEIFIKALAGGKLIGCCSATKGEHTEKSNAELGIMIDKRFREKGIGRTILLETIALAKKKWKPKNVHLRVVKDNKKAVTLYTLLGFRVTAVLSGWINRKGRYYDLLIMTQQNKKIK